MGIALLLLELEACSSSLFEISGDSFLGAFVVGLPLSESSSSFFRRFGIVCWNSVEGQGGSWNCGAG